MIHGLLAMVVILLAASVLLVPLAQRLGLGSVMGYLAAGVIVGPWVFGLVTNVEDIMHFSEIGVVLFLFLIGLEVEIKKLIGLRRLIFGLGSLQLFLCGASLAIVFYFMQMPLMAAGIAGLAFALSSTAIALQILKERNLLPTVTGQAAFSILLFQDLAVIPLLALLPLLSVEAVASENRWLAAGRVILILAVVIFVSRMLLRHVLRLVAQSHLREVFTALSLLLVLGMAWFMTTLDLSMGLGAFIAGVLLADSEYRHAVETDIEPFKGLLMGLFFMSVGMSINFGYIFEHPLWILAVIFVLLFTKIIIHHLLARLFQLPKNQRLFFSLTLSQVGEFAFVVFGVSQALKLISPELSGGLVAVVALSMITTPLFIWSYEKWLMPRLFKKVEQPMDVIENENNPIIIAGFGRFGQIVGRLMYANKIKATVLDHEPSQIELLRRFGFKVYYGDATRADLLHSAGAETAKIIVVAIDDVEDNLQLIDMVKQNFPHLKIFARARNMQHYYALLDRDINIIEREVFESSLRIGVEVLKELGWPAYQAVTAANRFREHNIKMIKDLHPRRSNEAELASRAIQARDDLEKMFEQEKERRSKSDQDWSN